MAKVVLFVPGFPENRSDRDYDSLLNELQELGYKTEFIDIDWRDTTQGDWARQIMKVYEKYDPEDVILAGFSFGAVAALIAAVQRPPHQLWLFSLSPLFAEYYDYWTPKNWDVIGERQRKICRKTSLEKLLKSVKAPIKAFMGGDEPQKFPDIELVFDQVVAANPRNVGYVAAGAGHAVDNPNYRREIVKRAGK